MNPVLNGQKQAVVTDLVERARASLTSRAEVPADAGERSDLLAATARQIVREFQTERLAAGQEAVDAAQERELSRLVLNHLHGTAGLASLLADDSIEDICCQGAAVTLVKRVGRDWEQVEPIVDTDAELEALVRTLAAGSGTVEQERRFDRSSPILDLQLPGGERLHATMQVTKVPCLTIRRPRDAFSDATLDDLRREGMFNRELQEFLAAAVAARRNIVIAGPTGSGKTTLLRALCRTLPRMERIVTIEDVHELGLDADGAHDNVVSFQARQANIEGAGEIDLAHLFRSGLRMSPSRVIVGEVRGDEALVMLLAMSQGNNGSMTTIHADRVGVFAKLALLGRMANTGLDGPAMAGLIADAVHLVIALAVDADGRRFVNSAREVAGADGERVSSNELFRPGPDGRAAAAIPPSAALARQLEATGWTDFGSRGWS